VSLPGIDPNNPRPGTKRQFIYGAGPSSGATPKDKVLIFGNKTSSGSMSTDVVTGPIEDDNDAIAKAGARSELYWGYKCFQLVPQEAEVYLVAVPESGGTAALVEFTVSGVSDANSVAKFHCHGETFQATIPNGATQTETADAIAAAFAAGAEGRLQVTAVAAIDGAGPDYKVTVTAAQKGPRGNFIIGATATTGLRVEVIGTNTQTVVKKVAAYVAGATDDDFGDAIAAAANKEYYYQISPAHLTASYSSVTSTDGQIGEHVAMMRTQNGPKYGKDQEVHFASAADLSDTIGATTDTDCNSAYAFMWWQENSDWSPMMLAAHHCAIVRQQQVAQPSANINRWRASDSKTYAVPKHYNLADIPTDAEITSALNNGICPIVTEGDTAIIERHITTRSLNDLGNNDYRVREGHIPRCMRFAWWTAADFWENEKQPLVDDDPGDGEMPSAGTSTPRQLRGIWKRTIKALCADKPLGKYNMPILKKSAQQSMIDRIAARKAGPGYLACEVYLEAAEHNIKLEQKVTETGGAY